MLRFGSFFSGVGLLDYGLHLAGIEHAWFCEVDPWRREILERRWPGRPVYPDIRGVGADTAVRVDGIVGGFPCKGASTAGKLNGFEHPETVLWREMARAVRELRPRYVVVENVANILALHDGAVWGEVLGDLVTLGFDVEWDCLPAGAVGAPHLRDRVFAVATYAGHAARGPDAGRRGEARQGRVSPERSEGADQHAAGGHRPPADADEPRADTHAAAGGSRPATGERTRSAPDADRDGVRQQPEPEPGSSGPAVATGSRGVAVDWGVYGPAIRRWEAVHGPAPEPLLRRVDDRSTTRMERSRLSALGDGVQVQVGQLVGTYIVERERGRLAA